MTLSNKLIILRDKYKYSQQFLADSIGVSKSTYCRFEKGTALPRIDEINSILQLYDISYEELVEIKLPIVHEISYPDKLLRNLEKLISANSTPDKNYIDNRKKYYAIKEALEPILVIRDEAMSFPDIDISDISPGTTVKTITMDMRGERLIDQAFKTMDDLFDAMQRHYDKVTEEETVHDSLAFAKEGGA